MSEYQRTVSENGQVTIPKSLRSRYGIGTGDTVAISDRGGELVIHPPSGSDSLAAGYRARTARSADIAAAFGGTPAEGHGGPGEHASPTGQN